MTAPRRPEDALPNCPLCGRHEENLRSRFDAFESRNVSCATEACALDEVWFTEAEWRRLASTPLPHEIVAVLGAVDKWIAGPHDKTFVPQSFALVLAWSKFENAGRPGLPPVEPKP